ncbi:MAG: DUF502 domain-containing protein [Planctomycetota bacterium]|jgi:uncharacterized membrane protein
MAENTKRSFGAAIRKYLLAGVLTVIPLAITIWIAAFMVRKITQLGAPMVTGLADLIEPHVPWLADGLRDATLQSIAAIILVAVGFILIGWMATKVIGRQLIALVDWMMERIPLVKTIYGATKKLLVTFQTHPGEGVQRVVLIDFPTPEMKAVGLVTRTFEDADTKRKLAAVYVPTTPNPTSGYLEIVPIENIVMTDWTVDEAMTFIVSGGAAAPERINYDHSVQLPSTTVSPGDPTEAPKAD